MKEKSEKVTPKKLNKETQHLDHLNTMVEIFSQKNSNHRCINDNDHEIKINNTTKNNYQLLTLENILANNEENHVEFYTVDLIQVETLQRKDRTLRQIMTNDPDRNYKIKTFE